MTVPTARSVPVPSDPAVPAARTRSVPTDLPTRVPVLISGGGPVGLAAAMELNLHGVACAVIEPRPDVNWLRPRAKTVSARTMEYFRRWGLAQQLRKEAPLKVDWSSDVVFCTTLTGREITRFHDAFGLGLAQTDVVAEPGQQAPQPLVEQILREAVDASEHATLVTGWRVIGAAPNGGPPKASRPDAVTSDGVTSDGVTSDGVTSDVGRPDAATLTGSTITVTIEDKDGRLKTVEADYVLGCDGARSVIRGAIGTQFDGSVDGRRSVNVTFRAPGLAAEVPHGNAVQYWVLNPRQPGLMGRLDLDGVWWCIANGVAPEIGMAHAASIVQAMTGSGTPIEVLATDAWTARMQMDGRYACGRMFIVGDAAHQNPPYGGHGFNTGIGDAVNIAWKLAAVLNGWAPAALLDTYESERRPVALDTIAEAARNMATLATELADPKLMGTSEEFASVLPSARAAIHRTKDREFHSLDLVLGYSYAGSPITADAPARPPEPGLGLALTPGQRLPHRWVAAGDSLYDHLGTGFTLIRCSGPGGTSDAGGAPDDCGLIAAASDAGVPLTVLDLDGPGWREHFGATLVLVRPDQHVSWAGAAVGDPRELIRTVIGHGASSGR